MPIIINKVDTSPSARAVLMIGEILKLNYETREVNMANGEHLTPEYIEKNPMHTVPLLEDRDFVLADSHAIITYLVSKYGAEKRAELYPSDLSLRATIDQRLFFDATVLSQSSKSIFVSILFGKATGISEQLIADVNEGYGILEKYLQKTRFVACDYFTLADVSCVATVSSLNALVPLDEKYEKVKAWLNKLEDEEWYQKANVPGVTQMTEFLKMLMGANAA